MRRRSSMAQNNASNASVNRIASAVEVHGNGAFAIVNSNDSGSDETRSRLKARAVTRYLPGAKLSIANCDSCETFCLTSAPLAFDSVNAYFFFQAEDGIRVYKVTGVQTCALPI